MTKAISVNAKQVLDSILKQFESGDIPDAISIAMFPASDSPSENWSLLNRIQMSCAGTSDARTFKQWLSIDRKVKKGSKAFHILAPNFRKFEKETSNGETEERQVLTGFRALPVFRMEDTDGEPIVKYQFDEQNLPLYSRAMEWGISVEAVPGNDQYYGSCSIDGREIGLATESEKVFFHELAHAAHRKVRGSLTGGQDPIQEIVAELSAAALCRMVGKESDDTTGNSYRYIARYAKELGLDPHRACMRALNETDQVLKLIIHGEEESEASEISDVDKSSSLQNEVPMRQAA